LINCHTHLEFSSLAKPFTPALPFTSWIKSLVAYRREESISPVDSIQAGLRESDSGGVGLVGEIATAEWPLDLDLNSAPELVVFRECIGRTSEQRRDQLTSARRHLEFGVRCKNRSDRDSLNERSGSGVEARGWGITCGLSPHAPYSVHPDLLRDLVSLGIEFDAPLAMHLAETQAELELLREGTGEFAEMLKQFGAWEPSMFDGSRRILDDLRELARSGCALVIHGNYLSDEEIDFLEGQPQLTVVYCPRTHHFFGHKGHPWRRLLERGINVAIGTDGRGSNPDLSIWNELRFLAEANPEIDPTELLSLATLKAARGLRCDQTLGSLTQGKRARILRVELSQSTEAKRVGEMLFSTNGHGPTGL
ncbi:MAG: amidohydrolase family protein, partial [Planctomycetaceae bacterium]|nr:amidohydrolase family protein [Planctomycetaceae bacterium]